MSVELATPDDVANALQLASTPEAPWAEFELEVATEWAKDYLHRPDLDASKDATTVFSATDVPWDGFVRAPETVTKVEVVYEPGGASEELGTDTWTYDGDGVRLRPVNFGAWGTDPRYVSTMSQAEPLPRYYVRVDVTSKASGEVDPRVKLGVAIAAGAIITRTPRLVRGLKSENIGDYSYTVIDPMLNGDPFYEQAKAMLRPLRNVGPFVTP